jgi:hypothetical protein
LLAESLDWATEQLETAGGKRLKVWVTTGPGNLSRVLAQHILDERPDLPLIRVVDWPSFAQIHFCEYKFGSRYWLAHDERGWKGLKMRVGFRVRRTRRRFGRIPIVGEIWRMIKRAGKHSLSLVFGNGPKRPLVGEDTSSGQAPADETASV